MHGIFRKRSFSCFDMTMILLPVIFLLVLILAANTAAMLTALYAGRTFFEAVKPFAGLFLNAYLAMLIMGGITTATEWKRIHATTFKKIIYTLTFPFFIMTFIPISFAALFVKVEWKPIKHCDAKSFDEICEEEGRNG